MVMVLVMSFDNTQNNGRSDAFVPASVNGEFYEYQFTADNLEQFDI